MLTVSRADVWAATVEDRPGGLSEKLQGMAKAGADLEFIFARRMAEEAGKGVVFITPLTDQRQVTTAEQLGFRKTTSLHSVRVEGPDEPGLGYLLVRALASEGINLRSVSATTLGHQFVMYLAFDSLTDANRALARLEQAL